MPPATVGERGLRQKSVTTVSYFFKQNNLFSEKDKCAEYSIIGVYEWITQLVATGGLNLPKRSLLFAAGTKKIVPPNLQVLKCVSKTKFKGEIQALRCWNAKLNCLWCPCGEICMKYYSVSSQMNAHILLDGADSKHLSVC